MDGLGLEWDQHKAASNLAKHAVSFEEAATVFQDAYARVIPDPDHSQDEDRFIILGMSLMARMLVVCHCYRESAGTIRIISARKASMKEAAAYRRYGNA